MHRSGLIFAFAIALFVAGCANTPHNNVLLFGTDTKVALDISSAATQGGAPQITLGYRRAEAVWMPLVVNDYTCDAKGKNCKVTTAKDTTGGPALLQGKGKGKGEDRISDSYSVFASFGAKFSGGATGGEAKASGGLAQFFATGIAAQKLAENPGVENALKINNPGSARAEADAALAERGLIAAAVTRGLSRRDVADAIVACVSVSGSFEQPRVVTLAEDAKRAETSLAQDDLDLVTSSSSASSLRVRLTRAPMVGDAMQRAVGTSNACKTT